MLIKTGLQPNMFRNNGFHPCTHYQERTKFAQYMSDIAYDILVPISTFSDHLPGFQWPILRQALFVHIEDLSSSAQEAMGQIQMFWW